MDSILRRFRERLILWLGGVPRITGPMARERRVRSEALIERERIYSDLHDDIGAKLLTLVHTAENPSQADLARSILQDLRDIVSRAGGRAEGTLLEVLAQIRYETEQRLSLMHSTLEWKQAPELPDPPLSEGQALHLFRIVREAVSNAIRHGRATRIRFNLKQTRGALWMAVEDDGPGVSAPGAGRGMENMKARAAQLHGTIQWNLASQGGTRVVLEFPLPPAPAAGRLSAAG